MAKGKHARNANGTSKGSKADAAPTKGSKTKRRILLIGEIACVIVVIVCAVLIFRQASTYWVANEEFENIAEEYEGNVDKLESDNPNCVGWIKVDGTRINYPVMYTPNDPEYYLHRNFEGKESSAGTPFLGKNCLINGNSSIIYGHNMNDGSMFATLRNFDNPDFGLNHTIEYKTTMDAGVYTLLACWYEDLTAPNPYRYWDQVGNLNEQEFNDYVANAKRLAMYDTSVTASYGDTLLALSTCSYGTADERFIVLAVKTETIYKEDAAE